MSKYNQKISPPQPDAVNRAGGEAYTESPKIALVNLLLTSFQKDKFYETADEETKRLNGLLLQVDPIFAAKASVYARNRFGMRSITHYTAAYIAKYVKGEKWTKPYFKNVVRRADDITEILGAYQALNGGKLHPIPNALKRGLGLKLATLKAYEIAKYKGDAKSIKLVDVANLVHPAAPEGHALKGLIDGTLQSADTWETAISAAGKTEGGEEAVEAKKKEEWSRLILEHKLGYFALIRNIRNIIESGVDDAAFTELVAQLQNRDAIKKSLVFPFRIMMAYKVAESFRGSYRNRKGSKIFVDEVAMVREALSNAIDLSLDNVPELPGKTLVALDRSGSMTTPVNTRSFGVTPLPISARDIGAVFSSALAKKGADLMLFHDRAWYHSVNPKDSVMSIANRMPEQSGGTNFNAIFRNTRTSYDRIIILSDMQAWVGYHTPEAEYRDYKRRTKCDPYLYCFDLTAYGDTQFPATKVYQLSGFSDKVFETMKLLETDREALVHEIEEIEL